MSFHQRGLLGAIVAVKPRPSFNIPRGGAEVARQAHNLEVIGSNPVPGIIDSV